MSNKPKFIAVAGDGTTAYSEDGRIFVLNTIPTEKQYSNIKNNKILFMTTECNSNTAYTTDSISEFSDINGLCNSVACGNGKFVAVSDRYGRILYSEDGKQTFIIKNTPGEPYTSVTHGNGLFVFVSIIGYTVNTENCENFTIGTIPEAEWSSVTYGNGLFVAVSGDGKTAYSENGINFQKGVIPKGYWTSITYNDGLFVAVGACGVAFSTDGKTFTEGIIPQLDYTDWFSVYSPTLCHQN